MKIQKIGYLSYLSEDTVVNCGNNHSFYKIKTLETELGDFSETNEYWTHNNLYGKFAPILQSRLKEHKKIDIQKEVFSIEGIDAEIIDPKLNKPLKGKFRVAFALEFVPDEPQNLDSQSPLDEIRREIQENS
ncbi:hypothetical protein IQ218_02650 [Synechocystis salina LEGE 06099]|uniref:KGK domain-containing protein n=1 Tax=Synechocystis salina TaxID=945780 RepID=UPI0018821B92|nr:KGK domain-containing protein [Synechocystis salina]MBE9202566.1 hypothetical protein [Synechocystis salina LEGE 06099]